MPDVGMSAVNLTREAKMVVNDFQLPAFEKNQTLEYELPSQDLLVKAEPDGVREILMNLISNAIKFTPVDGKITISHRPFPDEIITDVKDNGAGIKKEAQNAIFEQETGLMKAKRLAESFGGRLWLEYSEPGKGSAFSFALPRFKSKS